MYIEYNDTLKSYFDGYSTKLVFLICEICIFRIVFCNAQHYDSINQIDLTCDD
jgi:hypothetical protein